MVYCGKPSKGCSGCRERKIRCDQKKPGCRQCSRAKKTCSGYRNQLDLMFRDESNSVPKKAMAKARNSQSGSKERSAEKQDKKPAVTTTSGPSNLLQPHESVPGTSSAGNVLKFQNGTMTQHQDEEDACEYLLNQIQMIRDQRGFKGSFIKSLLPMSEDLAVGFFNTNHIHKGHGRGGHFDYVPAIYSEQGEDHHLKSSMMAVGLAGFANTVHSSELLSQARASYATALRLINERLQDPKSATKDSLLLAIMLLSIYETVTGTCEKSLKAWTEHINGAAALIKLRGHAQFKTNVGVRLFLQMFSNLMISCVQRGIAMPSHILVLRCEVARFIDTSEPAWYISEAVLKFIAFRSDVRNGMFANPEKKLQAALVIDSSFTQVCSNLPASWQYETIYTTEETDEVWNSYYHVYSDYWVAQIWNAVRICRILTNEYIRDALLNNFLAEPPSCMDREHMDMFQRACDIEYEMRDDILASVPQHTGFVDACKHENNDFGVPNNNSPFAREMSDDGTSSVAPNRDSLRQSAANSTLPRQTVTEWKDSSPLRSAGGYFLLWPLFVVGEMTLGTEEIRRWVVGRLRSIGDNMGIMQAHALAQVLVARQEIRAWDIDDSPIRYDAVERVQRKAEAARITDRDLSLRGARDEASRGTQRELFDRLNGMLEDDGSLSFPVNGSCETASTQHMEFVNSIPDPVDERHLNDQVIELQQTEVQVPQAEIGTCMDEEYPLYGAEISNDFELSINGSNSGMIFPSTWPMWEQETWFNLSRNRDAAHLSRHS